VKLAAFQFRGTRSDSGSLPRAHFIQLGCWFREKNFDTFRVHGKWERNKGKGGGTRIEEASTHWLRCRQGGIGKAANPSSSRKKKKAFGKLGRRQGNAGTRSKERRFHMEGEMAVLKTAKFSETERGGRGFVEGVSAVGPGGYVADSRSEEGWEISGNVGRSNNGPEETKRKGLRKLVHSEKIRHGFEFLKKTLLLTKGGKELGKNAAVSQKNPEAQKENTKQKRKHKNHKKRNKTRKRGGSRGS